MEIISTTLMALGLLLLSGCATLAPSPTATPAPTETPVPALATGANDVIGIWQWGSGNIAVFFQFDEDGTYRAAQRVVTNLEDSPQELGRFTLEGGLMTFVTSDESPLCAGQSGTWEVRLLEQGRLGFSLREDPCGIRATFRVGMILEPVSP